MNILVLSFYFKPDLCAGSFRTTSLIEELSKKLKKEDKLTIITTFPNRYKSFSTENVPPYEKQENVEIIRIKIPSHKSGMIDQAKSFSVFFLKAYKIAKSKQADLIFATSSRLFTAFLGSVVSRKLGKPLYLDIRDIFIDTLNSLSGLTYLLLKPILLLIEKFTFNRATKINLVSKGFESYFMEKFPHIKYSYFTNGIDKEFIDFKYKTDENPKKNRIKILYAGNIGQGQGLHKIIPGLAKYLSPKYQFEIIGDGGAKDLLLNSIDKTTNENIKWDTPINRTELIKRYSEADILFLHLNDVPAFRKVLPSKIFEYAATHKPILAGVSGYSKTFINTKIENAEVFDPTDVNGAIEAVGKLKLAFTKRTGFIEQYSRENIIKALVDDLLSILD